MTDCASDRQCLPLQASLRRRVRALGSALLLGSALVAAVLLSVGALPRLAWAAPQSQTRTIGDIGCATIQACIDTSADGDTIIIPANHYTESLTLDKAVSLLGAAAATTVIHALDNQRVMTVTGANIDSSVVISGLTFTGGLVTGTLSCPESCGGGLLITDTAQPLLRELAITNNQAGYYGGGLYTDGSLNLINAQFISNTSPWNGGGVYAGGAVTIQNSLFEGNACTQDCAGGGLDTGGTLGMTGTQFFSNTADSLGMETVTANGGGVSAVGAVTLQNDLFQGNVCKGNTGSYCPGGGLATSNSLAMTGTQFINNYSDTGGGGVSAVGAVTIQSGLFQSNRAVDEGGGLATSSALAMTGTQFISNTTFFFNGGGIDSGGAAIIQESLFQGNVCGIYTGAPCSGGGLASFSTLTLTDTQFISNTAADSGGGLWQSGLGNGRVINALFARNSAGTGGAALALASTGNVTILHTTIGSPAVSGGSAIAVLSGTVNITNTIIASYTVGISRTAGTVVETNSLFFGNGVDTQGGVLPGGGSLTGDPRWVNPTGDDYHIGALSAARGRGLDLGIATDFEGDPRPQGRAPDIGFDQYRTQLYLPLIRR